MSLEITAGVSRGHEDPITLEGLQLGEPQADEIVVEVAFTGICSTDIKAMHGKQGTSKPVVLGHEGVGTVVACGAAVKRFKPGSRVLMSFASCGRCSSCDAGKPSYCNHARALNMNGARLDGTSAYEGCDVHSHFFGQSSFATHSITQEHNAVAIPDDIPFEIAGAMGCGVITGAGTVLNVLDVAAGSSIIIFGAGGVGLSAAMAAKVAGASTIIVVDMFDNRLTIARDVGATHTFRGDDPDLVASVQAVTGGGANNAVEASGSPAALASAISCLGKHGVCAVAGAAGDVAGTFRWRDLQLKGLSIRGVIEGDVNPPVFLPRLMQFYREGRFPIDRITRLYEFADINQAIADASSGESIKPVLRIANGVDIH